MKSTTYNLEGKEVGEVTLPESVFGLDWNADLVSQVVNSLLSSRRKNIAHAKDRSEVRGGGKKPWKQKGTGRARHGSIRSPIWIGGGVAHGPRNDKNYNRTVNKKMRVKALYTILSRKLSDGEILFVDSIALKEPKTSEARNVLKTLSTIDGFGNLLTKRRNSALVALSSKNREVERSFRNFGNLEVVEARNIDPVSLLQYKYLVIENPEASFEVLPGAKASNKEPRLSDGQVATKN